MGGRDSLANVLDTVEWYDPARRCWVPMPPMLSVRSGFVAGVVTGPGV